MIKVLRERERESFFHRTGIKSVRFFKLNIKKINTMAFLTLAQEGIGCRMFARSLRIRVT